MAIQVRVRQIPVDPVVVRLDSAGHVQVRLREEDEQTHSVQLQAPEEARIRLPEEAAQVTVRTDVPRLPFGFLLDSDGSGALLVSSDGKYLEMSR